VKDLSPVLRSIKDKNPDAFVGFTYPPDTILASKQAKEWGLNPKFFYASVGTAFQLYKNVMTPAGAEGVLGMGSWNAKSQPGGQGLLRRAHEEVRRQGARPLGQRRTAGPRSRSSPRRSPSTGLDRKAIRDYVASTEHHTIIGKVKFTGSENTATPGTVSQWQKGEFEVVWPKGVATAPLNPNKPAWA
jgi:branched-chain amino acid transport system substrate-binding protein